MCERSSETLGRLADQLGWDGLLTVAVDGLVGQSTDELSEAELAATMRTVQTAHTRLGNLQALLFDARRRRVVARGRQTADGREDAAGGVRAARQLEQDVAGELGIGNGEAKRIAKAGRAIAKDPDAARAAKDGSVSAEHLRVLDEKLRDLDDLDLAARLRTELLERAVELPLVAFRRACDRAVAQADQAAAARAEDRRQARRSAKVFETDDGMLGLSARLSGIDAETVATAIDAYRRPDAKDQRRRPEQRTADALVDMATVALRHVDSTNHGHPPQILLVVDRTNLTGLLDRAGGPALGDVATDAAGTTIRHALHDTAANGPRDRAHDRPHGARAGRTETTSVTTGTLSGAGGNGGVVESVWCGPLPASELTLIQAQALVTLIARGGGKPTFVTTHTRQIPSGLWPLLVTRDGGCIADGCEVPAGWCDIVHLHVDYDPGGRLSEANAALVCRRHHRGYDHATRPLVAIWTDDRPILIRRDRVPDGARRTPPDHLIPDSGLQGPIPGRRVPVIDPATRQPTGRWLPPSPDGTEVDRDDAIGGSIVARATTDPTTDGTVGGTTADAACRITVGDHEAVTPDAITDNTGAARTDRDRDGYRRHRTADQPSLLAEHNGTYRVRAGPRISRARRPTEPRPRVPTEPRPRVPTDPRPRGPTPGRDRRGARDRDGPRTDPRRYPRPRLPRGSAAPTAAGP